MQHRGSQLGRFCPPPWAVSGDTRGCHKGEGSVLHASGWWKARMLADILRCTGWPPQQRMSLPRMSSRQGWEPDMWPLLPQSPGQDGETNLCKRWAGACRFKIWIFCLHFEFFIFIFLSFLILHYNMIWLNDCVFCHLNKFSFLGAHSSLYPYMAQL